MDRQTIRFGSFCSAEREHRLIELSQQRMKYFLHTCEDADAQQFYNLLSAPCDVVLKSYHFEPRSISYRCFGVGSQITVRIEICDQDGVFICSYLASYDSLDCCVEEELVD